MKLSKESKQSIQITYKDSISSADRFRRLIWNLVWILLFRPTLPQMHTWRTFLLSLFGAKMGKGLFIYPTTRIWAPWNLEMGDGSTLGPGVNCYSMNKVTLGANATVSQFVHLCTGTHDLRDLQFRLVTKPIWIGANAWVAADAFVGPGVEIGEGAVIGARAVVMKKVPAWVIMVGNPAKNVGKRKINNSK